jgi:hypothetical protein
MTLQSCNDVARLPHFLLCSTGATLRHCPNTPERGPQPSTQEHLNMSSTEKKKPDDRPKHETTIIVNGREKTTTAKELSFEEIVALAFENPPSGENVFFTVTYRRGHGQKPEGTLVKGETVKVKDGMIFNVTATDKS